MKRAFIFPGQGSQFIGMGKDIYDNFPSARDVFDEIDEALKFNLSKLIFEGSIDELSQTQNTQPALLAVSMAIINIITNDFKINIAKHINYFAGHSLGEYSAYCAAESFSISDAAKLLQIRGKAMQEASPIGSGSMIAILGANLKQAEDIAIKYNIDVANDNCPGQTILSGEISIIDKIINEVKDFKIIKLKVSAAFHSRLIEPAKLIMRNSLKEIEIKEPIVPIITNVNANFISKNQIIESLVEQITSRVRWCESIVNLIDCEVEEFIEIGAGKVLTALNKRINKDMTAISVSSPIEIEELAKKLS